MISRLILTSKEKKLFLIVGVVVSLLLLDGSIRVCQGMWAKMELQKAKLQKQWTYSSTILSRSASIEGQYNEVHARYPKLFEGSEDATRAMAELDNAAKAAGVQVDMIRPLQSEAEKPPRYEMSLRGSWPQVMKFLQGSEGLESLFDFPLVRIHRQDPSGELVVSAEAGRVSL
jgi:outer membrane murein-binding lipoprotein Lpp